ncbi:IclR family transcriptional regulator, partial [Sesbania bispinosa]
MKFGGGLSGREDRVIDGEEELGLVVVGKCLEGRRRVGIDQDGGKRTLRERVQPSLLFSIHGFLSQNLEVISSSPYFSLRFPG